MKAWAPQRSHRSETVSGVCVVVVDMMHLLSGETIASPSCVILADTVPIDTPTQTKFTMGVVIGPTMCQGSAWEQGEGLAETYA
jgi:hypothetical protein